MKRSREFVLLGILVSLAFLSSSCTKTKNNDLSENEQRSLKQYLLGHNIKVQPLASGLYYLPTDTGSGIKPQASDVVLFNFTLRLTSDEVVRTNIDSVAKMNGIYNAAYLYRPLEYRISWWYPGLREGFQLMREGEKATFIIPSSLAYGSAGYPAENIGSYYTLIVDVELIKVIHDPVAYETAQIEKFVHDSIPATLNVTRNDSGVYHIIDEAGSGDFPVNDKVVSIRYVLKLLDGTLVQKIAPSASAFSYTLGVDNVVPGFEQAVREMKKGESAWIIIPYKQGYGELPSHLPPFTTLVYYMNIVDIQ